MKKKCFLIFLVMMTCMFFGVAYGAENEITRKIVSVVYDDSKSMMNNNNYGYSSYAIQTITSLLGKDDKLNVVRMSQYTTDNQINLIDFSTKQNSVSQMKYYQHTADAKFEAMDTAKKWLIDEASYIEDTGKYWFIVITDGAFINQSNDFEKYLSDINSNFNNLEFEILFLNIGNLNGNTIETTVKKIKNAKYIPLTNNQEVYDALFEISEDMNFGKISKMVTIEQSGDRFLKVTSKYPLKKLNVFMQGTGDEIKSISNNGAVVKMEWYNVVSPTDNSVKGSVTHAVNNTIKYLDAGEYQIEFRRNIEIDKVKVLCESYVRPVINVVDDNDNILNVNENSEYENKNTWVYYTADKYATIKCELYNWFDDTKIPLDENSAKISVELINGNNRHKLDFDKTKNAYYSKIPLESGSNIVQVFVKSENFILVESNILSVKRVNDVSEIPSGEKPDKTQKRMFIEYSSEEKYKFVNKFQHLSIDESGTRTAPEYHKMQIVDLPDGIIFEVEGKRYKNGDVFESIFIHNRINDIDFYSNKNYDEKEPKELIVKHNNNFFQSYYWFETGTDSTGILIVPYVEPIKVKLEKIQEELYVPYSSSTDERYVGEYNFTLEEAEWDGFTENFFIQLVNVPNGISIEYENKKYKNNEIIPIKVEYGKKYNLKIYANNEYREIQEKDINLRLSSDIFEQEISWDTTNEMEESITIIPEVYPINVNTLEAVNEINVQYTFNEEYKHILKYDFVVEEGSEKNISGDFELQLVNVPNGIVFEYEDTRYKNGEKIQLQVDYNKIYTLDIYANSNYKESEEQNIILRLLSNTFNQQITWNGADNPDINIKAVPFKNPIKIVDKNDDDEIDTQNEVLELEIVRTDSEDTLNVIENVKLKNIASIEDNSSFFSGFTYKIENDEVNNTLKLTFKPNIFAWIKGNTLDLEIYVKFDNGIEETLFTEKVILTNLDTMVILKPCIILAIILVILMGYVVKRKFDSNAQILITEDGDSIAYGLTPNIITVLLPYVPHKTKIGMIKFKAGRNKTLRYSAENLKIIEIEGLPFKEYVRKYGFNDNKVVMRKDKSSVVIKTFDGTQKYEYLNGSSNVSNAEYKYVLEPSVEYSVKNFDDYSDEYLNDEDYLDRGYMEDDQI